MDGGSIAVSDRREIAHPWRCQREGDCCLVRQLVVTRDEVAAMQAADPQPLNVEPHERGFLRIVMPAGRCVYLKRELDGQATCGIYEARPFQCRRFMCLRPDPKTEPWEGSGPLGCRNLSDRLAESRYAMTFYESNQRRAGKWALAHGWTKAPHLNLG